MCLALFKQNKTLIINLSMTINTMMVVKMFLVNCLISFSKSSVLIIKSISALNFGFSNIWSFATHLTLQKVQHFFWVTIPRNTLNFERCPAGFCCKCCSSIFRITNKTGFLSTWLNTPSLISFRQCRYNLVSLRLLPLQIPRTVASGNTFLCSLSCANNIWSSCNMFLMFLIVK